MNHPPVRVHPLNDDEAELWGVEHDQSQDVHDVIATVYDGSTLGPGLDVAHRIANALNVQSDIKLELARAEAVCRELRHIISVDGAVTKENYGTLGTLLENWLQNSTSKFKYERPTFIKPQ